MKTKLLIVLCLFTGIISVKSQVLTQNIRGSVKDKNSQTAIPGALIMIKNSPDNKGAVTDENGHFKIPDVPIGRVDLVVSFMGYLPVNLVNLELFSAKELFLNIELEESTTMLNEVVIKASDGKMLNNEMAVISANSILFADEMKYAGTFGDPARIAANMPGVAVAGDMRNDIIVRGNSPMGILWKLEGVAVPNPNHFASAGSTGGPVSILNNNTLAASDFMTGAFPAEFGNALSGAFDLKLRTGNNGKREFTGQFGFNGLEMGAEGPLGKKENASSYLVNYRYSSMGLVKAMGINFGISAIPEYQDVSFKLDFPFGIKYGRLSIFGTGGLSNISLLAKDKKEGDVSFDETPYDLYYSSGMGVLGISYKYFFNEKTSQTITLAGTGSYINSREDKYFRPNYEKKLFYRQDVVDVRNSVNYSVASKINARVTIKSGLTVELLNASYRDSMLVNSQYNKFNDFSGTSFIDQYFVQCQYKFNDRIILIPGLHGQHFSLNDKLSLEPRLGFKWLVNENNAVSFGTGLFSQLQPLPVYFLETKTPNGTVEKTNKDLGFSKSLHFVNGYNLKINRNLSLRTEIYYQHLYHIPVESKSSYFSLLNAGADFGVPLVDSLVNKGSGKNYGMELSIEKTISNNFYLMFTGALFESKYKGSDKVERNTAFNGNYLLNILSGKEFPLDNENKRVITANAKYNLTGGKRYIPIDLEKSNIAGEGVYITEQAYSKKHTDYSRVDVKIGYKTNRVKVSQEFELEIQNILNRKNIFHQRYKPETKSIQTEYQMGIFPMIKYKILF